MARGAGVGPRCAAGGAGTKRGPGPAPPLPSHPAVRVSGPEHLWDPLAATAVHWCRCKQAKACAEGEALAPRLQAGTNGGRHRAWLVRECTRRKPQGQLPWHAPAGCTGSQRMCSGTCAFGTRQRLVAGDGSVVRGGVAAPPGARLVSRRAARAASNCIFLRLAGAGSVSRRQAKGPFGPGPVHSEATLSGCAERLGEPGLRCQSPARSPSPTAPSRAPSALHQHTRPGESVITLTRAACDGWGPLHQHTHLPLNPLPRPTHRSQGCRLHPPAPPARHLPRRGRSCPRW